MNDESYHQWSKDLFDRWHHQIRQDIQVGIDGAPFPERYFASTPRILFVLKEINGSPWEHFNLCAYLQGDKIQGKTWNNVVRWTQAIRQLVAEERPPEKVHFEEDQWIDQAKRKELLGLVAVINLKKVPGHSSSHKTDIISHTQRFSPLLEEQIAKLDPDVIVACGVHLCRIKAFRELKYEASGAVFHFNNKPRIIIWADHPQARKNAKEMFNGVVQACASAMGSTGRLDPNST